MKKYILIFMANISIALYSCDKDNNTDSPDPDPIITTEVFKSVAEAEAFQNGAYGPLQTLSSSFSFLLESHTESTVSFEGAETAGGPEASRLDTKPANSYVNKLYNAFYRSIGINNQTIEKLDSSKVTASLTQEYKDIVRGRALFTRALDYLYLVQLYGEVPLRLKSADVSKDRVPIDDIYAQIVKDLEEAEKLLPLYDKIRSNASKGAANALLARAYLTWGQKPLSFSEIDAIKNSKTDPAHSVDNEKLAKAIEYADKIINSGQYELLADFNQNFGVAAENKSAEHIYTFHHDGDKYDAQGNHQTHCSFTNRFNLLPDNHIGPADVTLLDRFEPGDKRKTISILTTLHNNDERDATETPAYKKYYFTFPVTSPRYGKFIHRVNYGANFEVAYGSSDGQPNDMNRIELRYAEVLLYKAEALFFLGRAGEALPLVNQLRARAGLSNLPALTEAALYKEWDTELFFEQKRWQNLVRWKKLIQTVQTVKNFEYYKESYKDNASVIAKAKELNPGIADAGVNAAFFAKIYKHLHAKEDNISGKFYRFPLPTVSAIDLGIGPQNPGY